MSFLRSLKHPPFAWTLVFIAGGFITAVISLLGLTNPAILKLD